MKSKLASCLKTRSTNQTFFFFFRKLILIRGFRQPSRTPLVTRAPSPSCLSAGSALTFPYETRALSAAICLTVGARVVRASRVWDGLLKMLQRYLFGDWEGEAQEGGAMGAFHTFWSTLMLQQLSGIVKGITHPIEQYSIKALSQFCAVYVSSSIFDSSNQRWVWNLRQRNQRGTQNETKGKVCAVHLAVKVIVLCLIGDGYLKCKTRLE